MKLIIQIPAYNEEKTLPLVISSIPKEIQGITKAEIVVIDDGSTDNTSQIAKELNVDKVLINKGNKGLAYSFNKGMEYALKSGADILVNTDGDNQYPSKYIPDLVRPIVEKRAEIVVGDRQTSKIKHFSILKRILQFIGTQVTKVLSGDRHIRDAVSGFRAYSREAMLELNITSNFSYILDTTVQSSNKRLNTVTIPIETNPPTRPSRLFNSMWEHIWKSGKQILRVYAMYKPLRIFFSLGTIFLISGSFPVVRFLIAYLKNEGAGMIQSLVLGGTLISIAVNMFALGFIGELMAKNRNLIEQALKRIKENYNENNT